MDNGFSQPGITPETPAPAASGARDDLAEIRALLLRPETEQLAGLRERIENPVIHAQDVSQVLPQAVALAARRDGQLGVALTPTVAAALRESVRRDPSVIVAAIFPVIGPAIRKAIAEAFSRLLESVNQTLDHSFSVQGLKWRLEAVRTGRPFAEVVLAHTLLYRVEQVLLIHRKTGLLLAHVHVPSVRPMDADMVSSMLTAIQDFARDSFHVSAVETLQTFEVGDLTVWVEPGPLASLAAVVRGQAPRSFRAVLQSAIETIHREQGAVLETFEGDAAAFELARPHLELCLHARMQPRAGKSSSALWLLLAVALAGLAVWGGFALRERHRWNRFVQRLKGEEGIVVTEARRAGGKLQLAGLRDPLAIEPTQLCAEFGIAPSKVVAAWQPYQALSPPLLTRRATQILQPPPGVSLEVQDGVLFADGPAPLAWLEAAGRRAEALAGIREFKARNIVPQGPSLAASQQQVEKTTLFFDDGTRLSSGQDTTLKKLAEELRNLSQMAAREGQRLQVNVIGHADKTGIEERNLQLSRQRAEVIIAALSAGGIAPTTLLPIGVGSKEPLRPDLSAAQEHLNRRVSFQVRWAAATESP